MTELYLLWCARRGRRLHLGFWTAYQCHLIATHPARNLTLCHILGNFVGNNLNIVEAEDLSPLPMVRPPGLFDIPYFVRTNAVYMRLGRPHLYAMGEEATAGGRVAMLERTVAEMAEENRQMKEEVIRLASVMERMLKESAGQSMLTQRQAAMETIVTELGEENHRLITEMNRMASVIDDILEEVTSQRKEGAGEPSGHAGQTEEPKVPETRVTDGTENKEAEVPAHAEEPARDDADQTGVETDQPKEQLEEQPAPPAPRRSRRRR